MRRQIEKALEHLHAGGDPDEIIFEVRNRFNRVRVAQRLVRDDLISLIKLRRENLEQQTFVLGRSIYSEILTDFMDRLDPAWQVRESITEKNPHKQAQGS